MKLLHDYIISLVNLYGIVHKEKVMEIYNEQNSEKIDLITLDKVMREDAEILEGNFAYIEEDYFIHETIAIFDDINDVLAERIGKPHYIPSQQELLNYRDDLYFEKTKYYNALLRYVTKELTDGDRDEAIDISEEIQYICLDDFSPTAIFDLLDLVGIGIKSREQINRLMKLVTDLANNTRLWANNGHTPNEIRSMELKGDSASNKVIPISNHSKFEHKIGRNDPCPCGSGKKYKNCCAR